VFVQNVLCDLSSLKLFIAPILLLNEQGFLIPGYSEQAQELITKVYNKQGLLTTLIGQKTRRRQK